MRRFGYWEVSGPRDCLRCAALGESSLLIRTVTLLNGDDAKVKFECQNCGFVSLGVVNVEGQESIAPVPMPARTTKANGRARLVLADPLQADREVIPQYENEDQALSATYPGAVGAEDLLNVIENLFPDHFAIGQIRADREITQEKIEIGSKSSVVLHVNYMARGELASSTTYSSLDGIPGDVDSDIEAAFKQFEAAVRTPQSNGGPRVSRPKGVVRVGTESNGEETAAVTTGSGDPTADKLMRVLRAGR